MDKATEGAYDQQHAKAFEEWLRRFQTDPVAFAKEFDDAPDYGVSCAIYFGKLLAELGQ